MYDPHCEVAVDEAMIKFQGRSSLKQYIPKKPIKRGIKVWVLGDSRNGFFSELEVYTGKEGSGETELGGRVMSTLTRNLVGKHHHVFFDNLFTSPKLLEDLLGDGIYSCGTARINRRGFPAEETKVNQQVNNCRLFTGTPTHTHTKVQIQTHKYMHSHTHTHIV